MQKYKVVVNDNGNTYWYKLGTDILHRENNLPAIEYINGYKYWYKEGSLHRDNGPAVEYSNGLKSWFYNGNKIHCKSNEEFLAIINKKDNCDGKIVEIDGKKYKLQIL